MIDFAYQSYSFSPGEKALDDFSLSAATAPFPTRSRLPGIAGRNEIALIEHQPEFEGAFFGLVAAGNRSAYMIGVGDVVTAVHISPARSLALSGGTSAIINTPHIAGRVNGCIFQTDLSAGTVIGYSVFVPATGTAATAQTAMFTPVPIASPFAFDQQQSSDSKLAGRIDAAQAAADVDITSLDAANSAASDAKTLLGRSTLDGEPLVMFSDDGILTLQWQRGHYGVALIFAGDGEASIAFSKPGQLYAQNGIDIKITDDLPASFHEALAKVLG